MIVYHGGIQEINSPRIVLSEIGRDFGPAFYTTDIKPQALRWAIRKANIENRKSKECFLPIVSIYEWNVDVTEIEEKAFTEASLEWLELVVRCRGDITYRHAYDVVIGKIADDNVGETVSYVMQGIMRKEDAIERLKFERINNQIAFCTEKALKTLCFIKSFTVEER